ncbi:hypothetical protein [Candidatus Enterococcus mansonii]|uniref:Uncharacterized protein n=1 Tax=Candidatus Enterococcus mansonii TaxID=1834181 RepID=A0A2C9XFH5_9ENTE|nr:hypothetical protein [Enterococcus sp. 4G2_DIV0659]OTO01572.1 hypothetical protein A5880_003191 [Enterococcus sp. 4G2_DIV0659]
MFKLYVMESFVLANLPDFVNVKNWGQEQGEALLILAMIGFAIYLAFKREWGAMIGMVFLVALMINIIKKPDETIIQWVQGIIDKLMGTGAGGGSA